MVEFVANTAWTFVLKTHENSFTRLEDTTFCKSAY